ncbi:MAG: MFS transporter [Rhodobacteraceae bacterium]|nr:MFS transporter [Paracoccaceae bacterium]
MGYILKNSWALFLGMFLLMLGNGMQGTLLGVRGAIEGFSPTTMSWIMSAYFLGFLGGSKMAPIMIARVGHVRVFAALASAISAAFIIYALAPDPFIWSFMRFIVGFSFAGVYVVAESWLNDSATNETRGQALSVYMIVQMAGIVAAQVIVNFADPSGFVLFAVISVVVSISFAPILLSVSPAPVFRTSPPMTLKRLFKTSPLGVVGSLLLGGVFSIMFGMSAVYGTTLGLSVAEISLFIGTIYTGSVLLQYPIGWLSDRMDRRLLIVFITALCSAILLVGLFLPNSFAVVLVMGFTIGASTGPLYSLLIAHTNDYLEHEDMANASGALVFVGGVGAIGTPVVVGYSMSMFGANSFFVAMIVLMLLIAAYGSYRMTRREGLSVEDTMSYTPVLPQTTPIVAEVAQEIAIEQEIEEESRF